jgi:alpha-ketoglutarate-dependent taurine dioxygenase
MHLHPHGQFDNAAAQYRHIEALPLAAAMGAEVRGVAIGRLTDEQFAEDAYTDGVRGHPEVQPVIKEADDRSAMVFGSGWHPLRAVEVPPYGGDTLWANAALAYRMLSDTLRTMIADLRVQFSMRDVLKSAQEHVERRDSPIGRLAATRDLPQLPESMHAKLRGAAHPLVRTHPVTGEKSLYVDGSYAIGIEGLAPAESAALLRFLVEHITQPAFTCRLRWEPGTLTAWDNRLCVHQAFNDYQGFRREMYRTTVAGERPQ